MSDFHTLIHTRKSCRKFSSGEIKPEEVTQIIEAALLSPTARNSQKWHFYVVDNPALLIKLADAKERGSQFVGSSAMCIVVACDEKDDEYWIEDCSIAAITMQYQADELGIGSCWCHLRGSYLSDGTSSEDVVRGIVGIGDNERVLCMIGFGQRDDVDDERHCREPQWERVTIVE